MQIYKMLCIIVSKTVEFIGYYTEFDKYRLVACNMGYRGFVLWIRWLFDLG